MYDLYRLDKEHEQNQGFFLCWKIGNLFLKYERNAFFVYLGLSRSTYLDAIDFTNWDRICNNRCILQQVPTSLLSFGEEVEESKKAAADFSISKSTAKRFAKERTLVLRTSLGSEANQTDGLRMEDADALTTGDEPTTIEAKTISRVYFGSNQVISDLPASAGAIIDPIHLLEENIWQETRASFLGLVFICKI